MIRKALVTLGVQRLEALARHHRTARAEDDEALAASLTAAILDGEVDLVALLRDCTRSELRRMRITVGLDASEADSAVFAYQIAVALGAIEATEEQKLATIHEPASPEPLPSRYSSLSKREQRKAEGEAKRKA